jgi:hypothetical protein
MASRNAYGKGYGRGIEKGAADTTKKLKSEHSKAVTATGVISFVAGALLTAIFKSGKKI